MAKTQAGKLRIKEKIGYALGDTAANITWRSLTTFLMVFYTDVFKIPAAAAGMVLLVARFSDGISDVVMGMVADRSSSKYGKYRPWILWSALPLGMMLALTFTTPDFDQTGRIIYAYVTYILLTLVYTANNVPYSALMGVMTPSHKERTSLSSYRFAGAYIGGIITQGFLIYLVLAVGSVDPQLAITKTADKTFEVEVVAPKDVSTASISTKGDVALFRWHPSTGRVNAEAAPELSFSMHKGQTYRFLVKGVGELQKKDITCVNQKRGYQYSMYFFAILLVGFLMITFVSTKERIAPHKNETSSKIGHDLKDLLTNRPWIIMLFVGLLFQVYNSVKQGVIVYYFHRFMHNKEAAGLYMIVIMIASLVAALSSNWISQYISKKRLFIYTLLFTAITNGLIFFAAPNDTALIFVLGSLSEFGAGIMPVLFFAMLGDAADYSEYKSGRRATGLFYSAGTLSLKFGGGFAGAIIGFVLSGYGYNPDIPSSITDAVPGIRLLMSWIPVAFAAAAIVFMGFYPLSRKKMDEIDETLVQRRGEDTQTA